MTFEKIQAMWNSRAGFVNEYDFNDEIKSYVTFDDISLIMDELVVGISTKMYCQFLFHIC